MRTFTFFSYVTLFAAAVSFAAGEQDLCAHVKQLRFWIGMLCTAAIAMGYLLWISFCHGLCAASEKEAEACPRSDRWPWGRYLLWALLPCALLHLGIIALCCLPMEDGRSMFVRYLQQLPLMLVLAFFYACALRRGHRLLPLPTPADRLDPPYAAVDPSRATAEQARPALAEQRAAPPALDRTDRANFDDSYPQTLYYILVQHGGAQLLMRNMSVRFFDIVFLYSARGARFVILRNGEMLRADRVLERIKKVKMHPWMLKISANYYINMLLVQYPNVAHRRRMQLQPDLMATMPQQYAMDRLQKALLIGRGMSPLLIPRFLASVKALDHKGWDAFIPLD